MKLKSVFDESFSRYGKVLEACDCAALLKKLESSSPKPQGKTVYVPSDAELESLEVAEFFSQQVYGGMPVQVGYCNGENRLLNCLEYHRGSEINVPADDIVLLLADSRDIMGGKLDTAKVEAFFVPKGTAILVYETTLHYAPCCAQGSDGFRVIVVLPKGTNTEKPEFAPKSAEDRLLWARNKWLLAHPDSDEAKSGAYVGLSGKNLSTADIEK